MFVLPPHVSEKIWDAFGCGEGEPLLPAPLVNLQTGQAEHWTWPRLWVPAVRPISQLPSMVGMNDPLENGDGPRRRGLNQSYAELPR